MSIPVSPRRTDFLWIGLALELSLGLLGAMIAWLAGIPLARLLWPEGFLARSFAVGVGATLPLLPLLWLLMRTRYRPVARLRRSVGQVIRQLFATPNPVGIAALSLAAGLGEEILFRGALQPLAIHFTTPLIGLAIASLLFGLVHASSWLYFALATLIGFYLGAIALATGEILSAIIVHTLYDFVAIYVILARGGGSRSRRDRSE